MPWKVLPNGDGTYRVVNAETGAVHMKRGSRKDAYGQIAIMERAEGMAPGSGVVKKRSKAKRRRG